MVPGDSTRPITDRWKRSFGRLGRSARAADLLVGTGGRHRSIEPRSSFALFLDRNRRAVDTINANLRHCRLRDQARTGGQLRLSTRVPRRNRSTSFTLPPQYQDLWRKALEQSTVPAPSASHAKYARARMPSIPIC